MSVVQGPVRNAPPGLVEKHIRRLLKTRRPGGSLDPETRSRRALGHPDGRDSEPMLWDLPSQLAMLYWDGYKMTMGEPHVVPLNVAPADIPTVLISAAREWTFEYLQRGPSAQPTAFGDACGPVPYGFVFVYEAFGVLYDPDTDDTFERHRLNRDRRERRFHERPDAMESCQAMAVDVDLRFWKVVIDRAAPRSPRWVYWPSLDAGGQTKCPHHVGVRVPGGAFPKTLIAMAAATAHFLYGDPLPVDVQTPAPLAPVADLRAARRDRDHIESTGLVRP